MEIVWARPERFGEHAFALLEGVLDDDERARAACLTFAVDRRAFIAAHGLLRLALSRISPADAVTFSLSHTRQLVACAVAGSGTVGIDVEEIVAEEPDGALLASSCTAPEISHLQGLPPTSRALEFTRIWTLKEAAAKALGIELEVVLRRSVAELEALTSSLGSMRPTNDHMMAFACSRAGAKGGEPLTLHVADDAWVTFAPTPRDA